MGASIVNRDPRTVQQVPVNAIQALNLRGLVVTQGRPVERVDRNVPPIGLGIFEVFGEMRTIDEQFFRHAPDVYAGSAEIGRLRNRDLGAITCRHAASANTSGPGADNVKVIVVAHGSSRSSIKVGKTRNLRGRSLCNSAMQYQISCHKLPGLPIGRKPL